MLKKFSVANAPPRFDLSQVPNVGEESDSHVFCHGKTAKLHSRIGGFQDEKQGTRLRKVSLMPPIPSARNSPSFSKTSGSRGSDGLQTYSENDLDQNNNDMYGLNVFGETGYLAMNSGKKSTAEKPSDTGFQLYSSNDSNKLPKILKPKKKVSKGSKRKKTNAMNDGSQGSQGSDFYAQLGGTEDDKGTSSESAAGQDSGELINKYGLDLKRDFNMEVTRPFTFSYFPEIHIKKKKKGGDKETGKKIQRKISKVKTPSSLS